MMDSPNSQKPYSEKQGDTNEVSFTDTNAETGATGGAKITSSTMQDLIGGLKKQREKEVAPSKADIEDDEATSGKKKKKKKKDKSKTKKVRKADRYEPQNYLLRIEGTICCASLIILILWMVLSAILLLIIIIVTRGNLQHMFLAERIDYSAASMTTAAKP